MKTKSKPDKFETLIAKAHEVGREEAHRLSGDDRFTRTWDENCPEAKAGYRAMFRYFLKHAKDL